MSTQSIEKEKQVPNHQDEFVKQIAENLRLFHSPEEANERVFKGFRLKQNDMVRLGKLYATFRVNVDPQTTQANIIETALICLEKALIRQGIEIEPISKEMVASFTRRSGAIKEGLAKNMELRREAKERKAKEEEERLLKIASKQGESRLETFNNSL